MATNNILTINVRGINEDKKRKTIFNWINNVHGKIIFLQETFCKNDCPKDGWDGDIIHNHTKISNSKGVAIMLHKSLKYNITNIHKKDDARALLINLDIESESYNFAYMHQQTRIPGLNFSKP